MPGESAGAHFQEMLDLGCPHQAESHMRGPQEGLAVVGHLIKGRIARILRVRGRIFPEKGEADGDTPVRRADNCFLCVA